MAHQALAWVSLCLILFFLGKADDSLESKIYTAYKGNPCVWLLNNEGGKGCHTTKEGAVGILRYLKDQTDFDKFVNKAPGPSAPGRLRNILVMESTLALPNLIKAMAIPAERVVGMLILEGSNPSTPFSPAMKVPGARSDSEGGYQWNPHGNGLINQVFPFPLWALGVKDSIEIKERAVSNSNRTTYPYYAAEMVAFMHPQTVENAFTSIRRGTSKPIGGHSTVTTVLPFNHSIGKEIILAVAGMDSASLFQLKTIGANADMSGSVALMVALDALVAADRVPISTWKRHPVFAWLDAEHWGSLGSKKLIQDLKNFTCAEPTGEGLFAACNNPYAPSTLFQNIPYDQIYSIIEPKQVGSPTTEELFIHQYSHDFTTPTAKKVLEVGVPDLSTASAFPTTSGVPPSALQAFIKFDKNLATKGIVITDHGAQYKNQFYESIFDNEENVNPILICKAASLLARSISALGRDVDPKKDPEVLAINANCTLVNELLDCLLTNNTCSLRREFLPGLQEGKTDEFPVHYSSVYFPGSYSEHQKFMHDWVLDRVQGKKNTTACTKDGDCNADAHESCVRQKCQAATTTFYHEAKHPNCDYIMGDFSNYYLIHDPKSNETFWTESDWTPIGLRLFLVTDPYIDFVFLGVAIFLTVLVILASFTVYKIFPQKFKVL